MRIDINVTKTKITKTEINYSFSYNALTNFSTYFFDYNIRTVMANRRNVTGTINYKKTKYK